MKVNALFIPGVVMFEPTEDDIECNADLDEEFLFEFTAETGWEANFADPQHSRLQTSKLDPLRYLPNPKAQGKLVAVTSGVALQIAQDLRSYSPTFKRWVGKVLSAESKSMMWIPPGFAYGGIALTDIADVVVRTTGDIDPSSEVFIEWSHLDFSFEWTHEFKSELSKDVIEAMSIMRSEIELVQ